MALANVVHDFIGFVLAVGGIMLAKQADPGNGKAIDVGKSSYVPLVSAGAETRTVAAPKFIGQQLKLMCDTYVGNIVVTVASAVNQTGNNTLTFGQAEDACILEAMTVAGALRWRIVYNDGVALSTV